MLMFAALLGMRTAFAAVKHAHLRVGATKTTKISVDRNATRPTTPTPQQNPPLEAEAPSPCRESVDPSGSDNIVSFSGRDEINPLDDLPPSTAEKLIPGAIYDSAYGCTDLQEALALWEIYSALLEDTGDTETVMYQELSDQSSETSSSNRDSSSMSSFFEMADASQISFSPSHVSFSSSSAFASSEESLAPHNDTPLALRIATQNLIYLSTHYASPHVSLLSQSEDSIGAEVSVQTFGAY